MHPLQTHQRQVHLDFHTSPYIHDVGCEFDAKEFAGTFKKARVNSVTIFAKCHHGMSYYPTKIGTQHPALKGRDLLGEQIEALHQADIRCPIYTTVAWEEDVAQRFPEWRQIRKDGIFAQSGNSDPTQPVHPGGWRYNNFLHPDYLDYIEAHLRELLAGYDVDGFFFDIVCFDGRSCWSDESINFARNIISWRTHLPPRSVSKAWPKRHSLSVSLLFSSKGKTPRPYSTIHQIPFSRTRVTGCVRGTIYKLTGSWNLCHRVSGATIISRGWPERLAAGASRGLA